MITYIHLSKMEKNFARARKTSYLSYGRIYSSNRKKNMSFAFYLHVQQKIWCKVHEKKKLTCDGLFF